MDRDQQQAFKDAVERKKALAEEASRHPGQQTPGAPDVIPGGEPDLTAASSSPDQPTPHHKSERHGHVTAENWNQ